MRYDEFVARVRERGEFPDRVETEEAIQQVLGVLAERLNPDEAENLAAELPLPAGAWLTERPGPAVAFDVREFLDRVGVGATGRSAESDAGAVLGTVAEVISDGELTEVLTRLPAGFAALFGRAALGD